MAYTKSVTQDLGLLVGPKTLHLAPILKLGPGTLNVGHGTRKLYNRWAPRPRTIISFQNLDPITITQMIPEVGWIWVGSLFVLVNLFLLAPAPLMKFIIKSSFIYYCKMAIYFVYITFALSTPFSYFFILSITI